MLLIHITSTVYCCLPCVSFGNQGTNIFIVKKKKPGKPMSRKQDEQASLNSSLNDSMGRLNISQEFQR